MLVSLSLAAPPKLMYLCILEERSATFTFSTGERELARFRAYGVIFECTICMQKLRRGMCINI